MIESFYIFTVIISKLYFATLVAFQDAVTSSHEPLGDDS